MRIENIVRALAGALIIASAILAYLVDVRWTILAAVIGLDLLQGAFTEFHPLTWMLRRAGAGPEGMIGPRPTA